MLDLDLKTEDLDLDLALLDLLQVCFLVDGVSTLSEIICVFNFPYPFNFYCFLLFLFLLYTADLFDIVADCGFTAHSYADDTQAYVSVAVSENLRAIEQLAKCIVRIRDWMASNRLKLNEEKTQVICLGTVIVASG